MVQLKVDVAASFVLNITMKKIAFAEGWSAQEERDHVDHLLLLWIFAE